MDDNTTPAGDLPADTPVDDTTAGNLPADTPTEPDTADASADAAKGDVQEQVDEEQAKGFFGTKVDPRPDSDYSLESGPDSPPAHPDDRTGVQQHHV